MQPTFLHSFLYEFVTLFVILDPIATVPVFLSVTASLDTGRSLRVAAYAIGLSFAVLLFFIVGGQFLLEAMHIPMPSFQLAGSVVLLLLLSMVFLVPALGMGIVISTFARNQSEAMQLSLMTMLPAFLLSGFLKAGTPFDTASTPVMAVQPLENAVSTRNSVNGLAPRGTGSGTVTGVTVPVATCHSPAPSRASAPTIRRSRCNR